MAFATFLLNFAGSLARFFTVIVEASDDKAYVFQAGLAIALTTTFMIQFAVFRGNDKQKKLEKMNDMK